MKRLNKTQNIINIKNGTGVLKTTVSNKKIKSLFWIKGNSVVWVIMDVFNFTDKEYRESAKQTQRHWR